MEGKNLDMGSRQPRAMLEQANRKMAQELDRTNRLSRHVLRLMEKDRKDISRMLHDHIGQSLVVTLMALDNLNSDTEKTAPNLLSEIHHLRRMIEGLLADVRRLSHNLSSDLLDNFGLVPAFKEMIQEAEQLSGIHIDLYYTDIGPRLNPEKEITLYRIAQEALDNAVNSSDASEIFVKLFTEKGNVTMIVEDNGQGFVPGQSPTVEPGSLGIDVMRQRALYAGGDFNIDSRIGEGTQVKVTIPINN